MEAAFLGPGQLVLHDVEIPVVHIHASARDGEPGTAVEDPSAPAADLGDPAGPADGPKVVRVEGAPVLDPMPCR